MIFVLNGQRTSIDISPKKICKWPRGTWKDVKQHWSFSSVQFSCSVVSNFMRPHGLQYARLPCPSPTPGTYSNSCPLSWWCHPTISSSIIPFSSCLQSFQHEGLFQRVNGQSIGVSASTSVLPMNVQDWFPLGLTGLISWQSKGLSRVFSSTMIQNINSSVLSILHGPALTSVYDYR